MNISLSTNSEIRTS